MKPNAFLKLSIYVLGAVVMYAIPQLGDDPKTVEAPVVEELVIPDPIRDIDFPGQVEPLEKLPIDLNGKPVNDDGRWKLILKAMKPIEYTVTGYTPTSDSSPEHKQRLRNLGWSERDIRRVGKVYANQNFLLGGKLYHPARPFNPIETKVLRRHYTVAIPAVLAHLHEDLIWDGVYWNHRYRIRIDGYTPPDVFAVPRDRCPSDAFDCLFTGYRADRRAKKWGREKRKIEIYRYDWVLEVQP